MSTLNLKKKILFVKRINKIVGVITLAFEASHSGTRAPKCRGDSPALCATFVKGRRGGPWGSLPRVSPAGLMYAKLLRMLRFSLPSASFRFYIFRL